MSVGHPFGEYDNGFEKEADVGAIIVRAMTNA